MIKDVEGQQLGDFVVPTSVDMSFLTWWLSVDDIVQVRYPHQRHGHAGKPSHSSKPKLQEDCLAFVDANTQLNGRSADSFGPTHHWCCSLRPAQTICRVGEFNTIQQENGKQTCSNGFASNWLKKYAPKVAICPHKLNYCDTCAQFAEEIQAKQTTLNRLQHTGSSDDEELKHLKDSIERLQSDLEAHKLMAKNSHEYHLEMVKRCTTRCKRIADLQGKTALSPEEEEELSRLQQLFSQTIGADYHMSKLVPSWGMSPQPGSTYYLQKLSHDIFGIDDYSTKKVEHLHFRGTIGSQELRSHDIISSPLPIQCPHRGLKEYAYSWTTRAAQTKMCTLWDGL